MQIFTVDPTIFKKNLKKDFVHENFKNLLSIATHFFSVVLLTGPKPTQNLNSVP